MTAIVVTRCGKGNDVGAAPVSWPACTPAKAPLDEPALPAAIPGTLDVRGQFQVFVTTSAKVPRFPFYLAIP